MSHHTQAGDAICGWCLNVTLHESPIRRSLGTPRMTVAGIDYSSRAVDIVLVDEDTGYAETGHAKHHRIDLHGETPFERARSLRGQLPLTSWWENNGVYLIGIEDPFSRSKGVAKALGLAAGAIAALLPAGLAVIQTAPTEWKKLSLGNAAAPKTEIETWARDRLGHTFERWPQDGYDAYAIAIAVRNLNNAAIERQKGAAA